MKKLGSCLRTVLILASIVGVIIYMRSVQPPPPLPTDNASCSHSSPCVSDSGDPSAQCNTYDNSPCVYTNVDSSSSPSGMSFKWSPSSNSSISNVDHYNIYWSSPSTYNSDQGTQDDPFTTSDTSWSLHDGLGDGQMYSVQVQECDSSDQCSYFSSPATIDLGYSVQVSQAQQSASTNASGQSPTSPCVFRRVRGQWPSATYYISGCTIQKITEVFDSFKIAYKGFSTIKQISQFLPEVAPEIGVILVDAACTACEVATTLIGYLIPIIAYGIKQLDATNQRRKYGVCIDTKRFTMQPAQDPNCGTS